MSAKREPDHRRVGRFSIVDTMGPRPDAHRQQTTTLFPSERRLVHLVAMGHTNREIATELDIVEQTVKNMLSGIYRRCGVRNRAGLVRLAFSSGMIAR